MGCGSNKTHMQPLEFFLETHNKRTTLIHAYTDYKGCLMPVIYLLAGQSYKKVAIKKITIQ